MKHKFISLLSVTFLMCASATMAIHATPATTTNPVAVETTVKAASDNAIIKYKTVKVNKKASIKKDLQLNKKTIKKYTLISGKPKVATVSASGKITGKKAGSAVITVISKADSSVYATINVKVKNRYTKSQLRLMSSIIYSEAGNQSYAGKKAVGIVVANRVTSKSFPNTLKGVIYQSGQFTPARNGSLNRSLALYDNGNLDNGSIKAAKAVLNGDKKVKLSYGTIDMSSYLYFSGYVKNARLTIGSHQFK